MKNIILLFSLLSITSAFATEATRENILFNYKKSLDSYYPENEVEDRYSNIIKIDAKVDVSILNESFKSAVHLEDIDTRFDKTEVMERLVYACLNESNKKEIYNKCSSARLSEELDGYYVNFVGQNDVLDTLIEDFFEVQTALLELTPVIKSDKINDSKRSSRKDIQNSSKENASPNSDVQQ